MILNFEIVLNKTKNIPEIVVLNEWTRAFWNVFNDFNDFDRAECSKELFRTFVLTFYVQFVSRISVNFNNSTFGLLGEYNYSPSWVQAIVESAIGLKNV